MSHYPFLKDVDECSASVSACDVNAICQNTIGSYQCSCVNGYAGGGKTCHGKRTVNYKPVSFEERKEGVGQKTLLISVFKLFGRTEMFH